MFSSYRRGDANDPDGYVAAIAAVLSLYDSDLIKHVTDPRTGISTHEKFRTFMPNSGELKAYCDEQQATRERYRRYAALPRPNFKQLSAPPAPVQGRRANVFVRTDIPIYSKMIEQAETADPAEYRYADGGIWVAESWIKGAKFT